MGVGGAGCYSTIGGGHGNILGGEGDAFWGTIGGGCSNVINESNYGVIGGGCCNEIASIHYGTIGGGQGNQISAIHGTIMGGAGNCISHASASAVGHGITSVTTSSLHVNNLIIQTGSIPTSDPGVSGMVWNDSGTLKIST
tara:strand:- start:467 stop:889 length:423 start_codon:yes stop_codon:yes gene_type:complete